MNPTKAAGAPHAEPRQLGWTSERKWPRRGSTPPGQLTTPPRPPRQGGALWPAVPGRVKTASSPWAKPGLGAPLSQSPSGHALPASRDAGAATILRGPLRRHWHEVGGKEATPGKPQRAPSSARQRPPPQAHPLPTLRSAACTQHPEFHAHASKRLATPMPHACPPRAGLAPPLLVLDSLLPVLAFSPHDLTAGHVMGGSPGSGPLGQKVAKWFHPQGASGFLGAWPARRAGLLLRFLPSVVGSFPLEVSLCP